MIKEQEIRKIEAVLIFSFIVLAVFLNLWTFEPTANFEQVTGAAVGDPCTLETEPEDCDIGSGELCQQVPWTGEWICTIPCSQDSDCPSGYDCEGHCFPPAPEDICDDGIDNDGDSDTDCQDSDCDGQQGQNGEDCEPSGETTCNDGFDNDGDGDVDCTDADCDGQQGPGFTCENPEQTCDDLVDNDMDGSVDCDDPDCNSDPVCQTPEDCDNGVDDDGDSLADCCDSDCSGELGCISGTTCSDDGPCGNYKCDTGICLCLETCSSDLDCVDSYVCDSGSCVEDTGGPTCQDINCIPYKCNTGADSCYTSCTLDSNCYNSSYLCNTTTSSCELIQDNGGDSGTSGGLEAEINALSYQVYPKNYNILFNGSGSTGDIISYLWDFGDETASSGETATHKFTSAGTYTVRLNVSNSSSEDSTTISVTINNGEPVAVIKTPDEDVYSPGESITLGHSSYDLDGSIAKIKWDYGRKTEPWGEIGTSGSSLACYERGATYFCTSGYDYDKKNEEGYPCVCLDKSEDIYKNTVLETTNTSKTFKISYSSSEDCQYKSLVTGDCEVMLIVSDNSGLNSTASHSFKIGENITAEVQENQTQEEINADAECKKKDSYSHSCSSGETDIVYKSSSMSCCCSSGHKLKTTIMGKKCVRQTTTDSGSVSTDSSGEISDIHGGDITEATTGESFYKKSYFKWVLLVVIISIVVGILGFLRFRLSLAKPSLGPTPAPHIPPSRKMPPTRPGGPEIAEKPAPPVSKPKKQYSPKLKASLSELAKKHRNQEAGSASLTRPHTAKTPEPMHKPLKKPLQRLGETKIRPVKKPAGKSLENYINSMVAKDYSDNQIKQSLIKKGWKHEQFDKYFKPKPVNK